MNQERDAQVFSACIHCGLPLRGGPPVVDREQAFCCAGCGIVWSFCGDIEGEEGSSQDRWLARLMLSAFLSMGVMVFSLAGYGEWLEGGNLEERASEGAAALAGIQRLLAMALCVPVVHLLGLPLLLSVLRVRLFLSADVLILLGVGAAGAMSVWNTLVISGPVWFETVAMVLVLTSVGKWLDARAKGRAREALSPLMDEAEGVLHRIEGEGEVDVVPGEIQVGEHVRLRPGERACIDGRVLTGRAFVDSSALTGESEPVSAGPSARLLAGSTVLDGCLTVEVLAVPGDRVQDAVARLLESAVHGSSGHVRLADRVARVLLPCVLALALGTFVVVLGRHGLEDAWQRSLAIVLIACPCAIGIATPLAYWVAIGQAWKRGILVKGADVLERLAGTRRVLLDKTGTLTDRRMKLSEVVVHAADLDSAGALELGAALEHGSEHPIGAALRQAHGGAALPDCIDFKAFPGVGVSGTVLGRDLVMQRSPAADLRTRVALLQNGELLAEFCLESAPVAGAAMVLTELRARGLDPLILTGDAQGPAQLLAERLGVPVEAELLPADKARRVAEEGPDGILFVGDGINDVGALRQAQVGLVVHGGLPSAIEAGDAALLGSSLEALPELIDLSVRTVAIARGNLAWAFSYNIVGLYLAASGRLTPVIAALFMVLSSVAVVLNSSRLDRASTRDQAAGEAQSVRLAEAAS